MEPQEIKDKLRAYIRYEVLHDLAFPLEDDTSLVNGGLLDSFSLMHIALFIESTFN